MMIQNWIKKGCIFNIHDFDNSLNFSAVPVILKLDEHLIRIYFSSRNNNNQSVPCFFDYNIEKQKVVHFVNNIGLQLGELGTFDDSGVMPSSLLQKDNKIFLYYIGWNLGNTVPFRNSIGLAVSYDGGLSFTKMFKGPIMDRTMLEPHFVASNDVLFEDGVYKIWYLNCVKWEIRNDQPCHYYHIKYATSLDGINWDRKGKVAIDFKYKNEYAISVPRVIREDNIYKMWYSYRGGKISENYRIGYAESIDGINWERMDEKVNLTVSKDQWDSEMLCYPFVFNYKNSKYMLYNGNDYGKTGIGLAELKK